MTVRCAQCGEEMLGAVNRCWKCGSKLVANPEQPDLPPLRRVASDLRELPRSPATEIADAEVLDDDRELLTTDAILGDTAASQPAPAEPPRVEATAASAAASPSRTHSVPVVERERQTYKHPMHHPTAATGGAIGALLLGVSSLVISLFTVLGSLVALVGLALGAWGASSNRRNMAFLGMLLCCLALLLTGYRGSVWAYQYIYGYSPFETGFPAEYEDMGPPLDPIDQ